MVVPAVDASPAEAAPSGARGRRSETRPVHGRAELWIALVALALRWWQPGETLRTTDEFTWLLRSEAFGAAVRHGDLAAASAAPVSKIATRPGLTTMWTGFAAEELGGPIRTAATWFGLGPGPSTLRLAHLIMGLICAAGIWVFTVLAGQVVGRRAGLVAGALLATEPVLVGHSTVLHTDALVSISAAIAVLALVASGESLVVGPSAGSISGERRARRLAALGGAAAAVALLTKVNAVVLVVPAMAAAPLAAVLGGRSPDWRRRRSALLRCTGIAWATCAVVTLAVWPSLWVDPLGQARATVDSARLAGEWTGGSFFLGTVTDQIDRRFYLVVAWYRLSGWFLIAMITSAVIWVRARVTRRTGRLPRRVSVQLWVPPVLYAIAITVSDKHYDRYLLPLLPFIALGIGLALALAWPVGGRAKLTRWGGWAAFAAASLWTASLAPFAISHVDPLVGGQATAETRIPLGWGEGVETLLARTPTPSGRCPTISSRRWLVASPGCFEQQDFAWLSGNVEPPDYVLTYLSDRQMGRTDPEDRVLARRGRLVDTVRVQGVAYVELWTVRDTTDEATRSQPR